MLIAEKILLVASWNLTPGTSERQKVRNERRVERDKFEVSKLTFHECVAWTVTPFSTLPLSGGRSFTATD